MTDMSMNDTTININTAIKLDNVLNGTNISVSAAQDSNTAAQTATAAEEPVAEVAADLAQDADYMKYATEYERKLKNKVAQSTAIANYVEDKEEIVARTRTEYAKAFKVGLCVSTLKLNYRRLGRQHERIGMSKRRRQSMVLRLSLKSGTLDVKRRHSTTLRTTTSLL